MVADLRDDWYGLWEIANNAKAISALSPAEQRAEAVRLVKELLERGWVMLMEEAADGQKHEVPTSAARDTLEKTRAWDREHVEAGEKAIYVGITPSGKEATNRFSTEIDPFLRRK
jgi:hypothetical protein